MINRFNWFEKRRRDKVGVKPHHLSLQHTHAAVEPTKNHKVGENFCILNNLIIYIHRDVHLYVIYIQKIYKKVIYTNIF